MSALRDWTGRAAVAAIDGVRRIRSGTRVAEGHYLDGRRLRGQARSWSDAQREAWMLAQLRRIVRHAAETPFYRARFHAVGFDPAADFGFEDYARLPILERADVAGDGEAMLSPRIPPAARRKDGTGGSTGTPLSYFSGPEERGWRLSGQDDFMSHLGLQRGESMAYLWGHHIDQRERETARERLRDVLMNRRWFDCFRLSPEVLARYHRELTAFMPNGLLAYASALDALATELLSRGLSAPYPVRRLVTGAEKLWPAQRARIQQAFAAPLHEQYGSREIGLVAAQHGDPSRSLALDVDWANLLVEPEGAGPEASILVTKLHGDAMPMLRYRIGDQAHFGRDCRPGHPTFQLQEVLGRQLDGLHLPDGRWVHGVGIPHMMKDLPVREFQIRQAADYSIEVSIVPGADYTPNAAARIAQVLGDNLPGIPIQVRTTDAIPRSAANKWRPVITNAVAARTPSPSPTRNA